MFSIGGGRPMPTPDLEALVETFNVTGSRAWLKGSHVRESGRKNLGCGKRPGVGMALRPAGTPSRAS